MKYVCIGEHLKHSFSKEIHNALSDYDYEIFEIAREKLDDFLVQRNFVAINVTIPYKELVIPHLHYIDEHAKRIGAVNTVVNRNGKLYGYNTDFYGMSALAHHAGIDFSKKKVIILGTGGTSKTARAVAEANGASSVTRVSRDGREDAITYDALYSEHSDAQIIINTTPVGMYPKCDGIPVDISKFPNLIGVIDAIYNPLRTRLVSEAESLGISAEGGLYMLVAQAVLASEIFLDTKYPDGTLDSVYKKILCDKENIVLTGMPASGKSTVGKLLSDMLGRAFIDTDTLIEEHSKMSIPEIFQKFGEAKFRDIESDVIKEVSTITSAIIATGGGAILREENIKSLKRNGKIYFLNRPLSSLVPTDDRPLSSDVDALKKRFRERYDIYCATADSIIEANSTPEDAAKKIWSEHKK